MLHHALRRLARTPAFAVAALLTLALGTGAVTAAFAIVHGVLLAPLPYGRPERLVQVSLEARGESSRRIAQPPAVYLTYRRHAREVASVGFYRTGNANIWRGDATGETPERVPATWVTATTLPLLQVRPALGRTFAEDEDRAHGPNVVVLSASVWRSRFHGAPDVIGRALIVNSVPREIIGVMPDGFAFPDAATKLWLPARVDAAATTVGDFTYDGVARLAPNASARDAQRELAALLPRVADAYPRLESGTPTAEWLADTRPAPVVRPLREAMTADVARTLWMVAAAAGLVLLVAWANVSNLMLVRADGRQLELAAREALGATRWRILTHFLGESFLLAAAAGMLALIGAWSAVRALVAFGPSDVPRLSELHVGFATVACAIVVTALGALVCGAVPAVRIRRTTLSIALRDGGRGDTASRTRQRLRATIASMQIALALVVTIGSTLLLRTFERLYAEAPGFDAAHVLTVWTQLPFARYDDSLAVRFYARLHDAAAALPGVQGAGLTTKLPLGAGETRQQSVRIERDGREVMLPTHVIDDGYFAAMRIPVLAGRAFAPLGTQRDGDVIVSRRAAGALWHDPTGARVIGERLTLQPSGPTYTVVGVVGDVRTDDLATAPAPTLYVPQAVPLTATEPQARRTMALVVRTHGDPSSVASAVRRVVRDLDPAVPIFDVAPMTDVVRASTARLQLVLTLMIAAAAITLALGAIGLYGVMAYMVALRTRELGVRVALGARPAQLARAVATRGLRLVVAGVAVGMALYALASPLLRAFLYGVTPTDPVTLSSAVVVLGVVASFASWLPARRAARVDPAVSLRSE